MTSWVVLAAGGHAPLTVLLKSYIISIGSRVTGSCPYARSCLPHVIIFSANSMQLLIYLATCVKDGFWGGRAKQEIVERITCQTRMCKGSPKMHLLWSPCVWSLNGHLMYT